MAGETIITVVGNLTADPELRSTKNGRSVAGFTIASTPRTFDRQSQQWVDGDALFLRCTVWGDLAEHCANSLAKGMRVVAQGRLTQHSWEDEQHQKRSSVELQVDEIGPSLAVCDGAGGQGAAGYGWSVWQSVLRSGRLYGRGGRCVASRPTRGAPTRPRLPRRSARSDSLPNRNFRKPKDESWTSR